jgi:hypothetical protein
VINRGIARCELGFLHCVLSVLDRFENAITKIPSRDPYDM